MRSWHRVWSAGLIVGALACTAPFRAEARPPSMPAEQDGSAAFRELVRGYLESYFEAHPVRSTRLGIHGHDSELPDLSPKGIGRRAAVLREWLSRVERIERASLQGELYRDHRILDHAIRAELLEIEEVRGWQRNPMGYNQVLARGVASLVDREFEPLDARLTSLISRLAQFSRVIDAARRNLSDVPRVWVEIAVRDTRGTAHFLRTGVPAALSEQGLERLDPALARKWERAHRKALKSLEAFADWLEQDLLPDADGDFRLGAELFERKLLYEEHIDLSADELKRLNDVAIRDYRQRVAQEAARIAPSKTPQEVMESVTREYPGPDDLLPVARRYVEQARDFVVEHRLVTLPDDDLPIIRPTPEYARSGFASMSAPGPFETAATEAYFNITNVDPSWTDEQQHEHLTYFNYPGLLGISVHEVMPGHFVQMLYQRELPTELRKVFAPPSLVEGWAHYAEQMMVDEGLGDGDPAVRLAQLRRALQRHARWDAGLALHAFGSTVEEAAGRFQEIAFFSPFPALRETRRGTYDPTYLYYAMGRMMIFELRDDYRRYRESRGESFSLLEFHDRFLRLGLPIPLAREVLIPDS